MAEAAQQQSFAWNTEKGEKVFFIFPVYFGGLPPTVRTFLEHVSLSGEDPEIIGIATYGTSPSGVDRDFRKTCAKAGLRVRAFYAVKMPENCIFFFNLPIREKAWMELKRSNIAIRNIMDSVEFHHRMPFRSGTGAGLVTALMQGLYRACQGTGKFQVTDKCTGCGACAKHCPDIAIEMRDGHPVWAKTSCEHCSACINRCPAGAIEYGRATRRRFRYVHPDLQKKHSKTVG